MTDWSKTARNLALPIGVIVLGWIASTGDSGKVLAFALALVGVGLYLRSELKKKVIDPVKVYYETLMRDAHEFKATGLGLLRFTGDKHNKELVIGRITGGPICRYNAALLFSTKKQVKNKEGNIEEIDSDPEAEISDFAYRIILDPKTKKPIVDPRAESIVFSYSPNASGIMTWPLIGGILQKLFGKEYLFCVYKKQLWSQTMHGNIDINGISPITVGEMRFVNDRNFDYDLEMAKLTREVKRITLVDYERSLREIVEVAVKTNPGHTQRLQLKDEGTQ